jgi:chemotaxis signal transduction protein
MATYSPLRLRRQVAKQAEAKKRLILFQLQSETFALPLDDVAKVTTLERLYGDADGTGAILMIYQGREIAAIDVGQKIFGQPPTILPSLESQRSNGLPSAPAIEPSLDEVKYSIVLRGENDRLIGLPIDSQPSIGSISMSTFTPLAIDLTEQPIEIRCVRLRSQPEHKSSIYLLDTSLLLLK